MTGSAEAGRDRALHQAGEALRAALARIERLERERREPVAVVGMGCRFPGGTNSPQQLWRFLLGKGDGIRELPAARRRLFAGMAAPSAAGWLEDVAGFDAPFFGISPREAASLDPQQRLLMEVCWEALEDAGIVPAALSGSRTGVFVAMTSQDYQRAVYARRDLSELDLYALTGTESCFAAGRLAYTLGVQGPALTVDTACSSSLVALHLACRSLRSRESNLALATGVNLILAPAMTQALAGALSPDGRCRSFAAGANGYVRAEGAGALVLKRLGDAQKDGDFIWAVVRGTAVNHDGHSAGLTAPNLLAQQAVLRDALADGGVDPSAVGLIETHGTGTELGDPIELEALKTVFGRPRADGSACVIGAVKTNLGHLEAAAGLAGVMKAVLALRHREIPANLHFERLNPLLSLDGTPFVVPTEARPWPASDRPRVAGVSSFGMSGTNAHVLIEEAPAPVAAPAAPPRPAHLFPVSARSEQALQQLLRAEADHLDQDPAGSLSPLCRTAAVGRQAFERRIAVVAADRREAAGQLREAAERPERFARVHLDRPTRIALLFTGQGSQHAGMGRALYAVEPVYRDALDLCDRVLLPIVGRSVAALMHGPDPDALLDRTEYTQVALFSLEYALWRLWQSWGVEPTAVMGHSVGEYVAATVAGVLQVEDALALLATRARLMGSLPPGGAMAAVQGEPDTLAPFLARGGGRVTIAAHNGPRTVAVAGDREAVERFCAELTAAGMVARPLKVSHAFHSSLMEPILEPLGRAARRFAHTPPRLPLISNLTGEVMTDDLRAPAYWVRHTREPVQFARGMQALQRLGVTAFLEVGPHPTLINLGRQCLDGGEDLRWMASLSRGDDACVSVQRALGDLYCAGLTPNWTAVHGGPDGRPSTLPSYPFQRQPFWMDAATAVPVADSARQRPRVHLLSWQARPLEQGAAA